MSIEASSFNQLLQDRWNDERLVCVGLDPDLDRLPDSVRIPSNTAESVISFNTSIIDATHEFASSYKPNSAYYEKLGLEGVKALIETITYVKRNYPAIPVILDGKRGDIGTSTEAYESAAFDVFDADAATVNPYFGRVALQSFLSHVDKGVIVMGANTDPGAGEFQDLPIPARGGGHEPLYKHICRQVSESWNINGNCAVTACATQPEKVAQIRSVIGDMPILLLGAGAQGGDIIESVNVGIGVDNFGLIVNSSRSIIYASPDNDFAEAANAATRTLNDTLRSARDNALTRSQ